MSQQPSLRELLAPMVERQVDLEGPSFRVDRARVLARMAAAGTPKRRSWVGSAALAAAAVAVLGAGVRLWPHESGSNALAVTMTDGSGTRVAQLTPKGELETAAGSSARVTAPDGLRIDLSGETHVDMALLQASVSQVKLSHGAVRCSVPHRSAGHAFQVVTPDVTVVDLGTVFTVSLDDASHSTRVSVEEGQVLVRDASGQRTVLAPNRWVSAPVPAASAASTSTPDPVASHEAPAGSDGGAPPALKTSPPATLAQEAQLLRQGLAAERQGRSNEAVAAFSQLLKKYPHSPLAPDARAALGRVLGSSQQ